MTPLNIPQADACTLTLRHQQVNAAATSIFTRFNKGMSQ